MATLIQNILQMPEWFEQNIDPRIKSYFFMNSIWPVFFVLSVYLLFVFKIGPEFMKHRKPFNIDRIVKVYNCVQILLNFYLLEEQIFVVWAAIMTKLLDLLDTVFFVLRKKQNQVTFLHVYHHTMVIVLGWVINCIYPGGQSAFFGSINTFIHIIMYSYYYLTILNPEYKKAWWKKYLTSIQLIQFIVVGTHAFITLFEPDCYFPRSLLLMALIQNIIMFVLFYTFYKNTYIKPKKNQ